MKDGGNRKLITEKTTQTMMDTFLFKQQEKNRTQGTRPNRAVAL